MNDTQNIPRHHRLMRYAPLALVVASILGILGALSTLVALELRSGHATERELRDRWYQRLATGNPQLLGTFRTTDLQVDLTSTLGAVGNSSNVGVGVTNINGPTRQTVTVPGGSYNFGELNLSTIDGAVPDFPHDLFVSVIRNTATADTTAHASHTGGYAIEVNAIHNVGADPLVVTALELDSTVTGTATSGDTTEAIRIFHGDVVTDSGNILMNGANSFLFQEGTSGFIAAAGTIFPESSGTNAIDISGAPTNAIKMRQAASQIDVDNAAPSTLTLYNAGGGSFALTVSGTESIGGALDMTTHLIHNVVDPVAQQDAATKNYVNNKVSGTTNTLAMFVGSNTVGNSPIVYDGVSLLTSGAAGLTIGTSGGSPVLEPLIVNGTITSNSGSTNDFLIDPNGLSYVDSVVGGVCNHGSGTDETFAIGFVPNCAVGLLGSLDVRTNSNTITGKDSGAAYINATDTVNTGGTPQSSYGLQLINASGRGTGTGALTTYSLYVDNPGNGQTNYGVYVNRGGETIAAGGLSVLAGTTALQATTTTTLGATSITGSSLQTTGNIVTTAGSITTPSTFNDNNFQIFGGSTNNDLYIPSASNQIVNIDSSGNGAVNINTNADGIANAGTGGLTIGPGNNSSLLGTVFPGTGQIEDRGTNPTLGGCGTTPVISGGAYSGRIQTDSGATSCVLTFVAVLHGAESCIVVDEAGLVPPFSHTTGALTITAVATHTYDFDCRGH